MLARLSKGNAAARALNAPSNLFLHLAIRKFLSISRRARFRHMRRARLSRTSPARARPTRLIVALVMLAGLLAFNPHVPARKRRAPVGGRVAVVVDERLSALRDAPDLSARLVGRLGRGRMVAITATKRTRDGISFHRVSVTRRTRGWLQAESVVLPSREGDDARLLRLIRGSQEFDRIARARIFLDIYPASALRPAVLALYGETAQEIADKLSREAARRLDEREMEAGGAPPHSYFMNYNGLDRYQKQGLSFTFDRPAKRFNYDGAAWREILRRYPRSAEATRARTRLDALRGR